MCFLAVPVRPWEVREAADTLKEKDGVFVGFFFDSDNCYRNLLLSSWVWLLATVLPPHPSLAVANTTLRPQERQRQSEKGAIHGGGYSSVTWICTKTTVIFSPRFKGGVIRLAAWNICRELKKYSYTTAHSPVHLPAHSLFSWKNTGIPLKLSNIWADVWSNTVNT